MLISTNVIHESKISGRIGLRVSLFGNRFTIRYFVLFIWKNHDLDMDGPFLPQKHSSTINFVLFNRTVKFVNTRLNTTEILHLSIEFYTFSGIKPS